MRHLSRLAAAALLCVALGSGLFPDLAVGAPAAAPAAIARWAEPAGGPPDYIFPFMPIEKYTTSNVNTFQYLMYRPLYWFGSAGTPDLDAASSLALAPVYSNHDTTVTITLKANHWSNGEAVSSRDVAFWLNLLHADKGWWGAYSPGSIPDTIRSVSTPTASTLVLTLAAPVNPRWFTANQLGQITPLPRAWDVAGPGAAAGSGGCADATFGSQDAACNAVFGWLSRQAGFDPADPLQPNGALETYATNSLWQVVDGPWRLSAFDATGRATFVPNPAYRGPSTPRLSEFIEVPFATVAEELHVLSTGGLDVGYLPLAAVPGIARSPVAPSQAAPTLAAFTLRPQYPWAISYVPYNFGTTQGFGVPAKLVAQHYVRQAIQSLVDQDALIRGVYKGFAVPTYGPTPTRPAASSTRTVRRTNPYPYSPRAAIALLRSHGWRVVAGGTSTCKRPGSGADECGAGIPANAPLHLTLEYASDVPLLGQLMNAQQASWSQAGIAVSLTSAPSATVAQTAVPCVARQTCSWELASSGVGWLFEPSTYPTGEALFATGAASNLGSYSSAATDQAITATVATPIGLAHYARDLSFDLPVIWQPTPAATLTEIRSTLHGVTPQNPLRSLTPERWSY